MYEKEVLEQEAKIEKMKTEGKDEYDIKKQVGLCRVTVACSSSMLYLVLVVLHGGESSNASYCCGCPMVYIKHASAYTGDKYVHHSYKQCTTQVKLLKACWSIISAVLLSLDLTILYAVTYRLRFYRSLKTWSLIARED